MASIGNKLKQARVAAGMKQADVAAMLDCAPTSLTNWENDKVQPSLGVLSNLCSVYNISPLSLLSKNYDYAEVIAIAGKPIADRTYEEQIALNFSAPILERLLTAINTRREAAKKILLVFGTRPEAIKMCPLVCELRTRGNLQTVVCVTSQHRQMLAPVLEAFHVVPDYDLSIMQDRQTLFDITTNILPRLRDVLVLERPDIVLVQGDTSTTFAAALACFYLQIPVGHVEAGLRTHDITAPYPEEFNRQAVSIISRYNFAPTEQAKQNLLAEGRDPKTIYVTGNTVIDALKTTIRADYTHPQLDWARGSRLVLITAHRRENLGEPMKRMFRAIRRVIGAHPDVKAIYPIHMNPAVREAADEILRGEDRIRIIEPLDVPDFHNFLSRCYLVLTDSGGIQEEAPALGKPVLVMRDTTERPEGIAAGTLKLVGTEEESIYRSFQQLLDDEKTYQAMSAASNPYGDGFASRRIADILETS